MPRTPSHPHVLRAARQLRGMSQEKLAALTGVAAVTIQKIEGGQIILSPRLAWRIAIATGLRIGQLLANSNPDSPQILRVPRPSKPAKQVIKAESRQLGNVIAEVFAQCPSQEQFWVLRWAIYEKLAELGKEFGVKVARPVTVEAYETVKVARKREPRPVSPGSGNGERKPANLQRAPSVPQSRQRA